MYILLAGFGPDNGPGKYMTSYRSELGVIIAGLAVLGKFLRSGLINARHIKFVCDNSAASGIQKITNTEHLPQNRRRPRFDRDYEIPTA
jgi:hypothetical protein